METVPASSATATTATTGPLAPAVPRRGRNCSRSCSTGARRCRRARRSTTRTSATRCSGSSSPRSSGRSYNDFVRESITEPLGLAEHRPRLGPGARRRLRGRATPASTPRRHRQRIAHVDTRAMAAATGFHGTASDLVRYFSQHVIGQGDACSSDHSKRLAQRKAWSATDDTRGPRLRRRVHRRPDRRPARSAATPAGSPATSPSRCSTRRPGSSCPC